MSFEIYNADIKSIIVDYNDIKYTILPSQKRVIETESDEVIIKLYHLENDKFKTTWYILNEIFTLSQMRTVLVVDGEYILKSSYDTPLIKVKNQEFVFDKNTSYETFVFNSLMCSVTRRHLEVCGSDDIFKKAKFLYLFGGNKTMLPLSFIALISTVVKMMLLNHIEPWVWYMFGGLSICFLYALIKYIKALIFLKEAMKPQNIMEYLTSERKEFRTFSDSLNDKYLNCDTKNDIFF